MNSVAKRKMFVCVALVAVSIPVLALGLVQAQREPALAELAIKPDDLKGLPGISGFKFIKSGPSSVTDSTQPLSDSTDLLLNNALMYEEVYAAAATIGDEANRVVAVMGNYLYRYPDPTQAQGSADQVIGAILRYHPGGHLIGLQTQDGPISGRTAMFIASEGDAVYWFVGTQDNVLILLMVNGPATSSTEELFKALVTRALR